MNIIHRPEHGVPIPTTELHEHGIPVRYWGAEFPPEMDNAEFDDFHECYEGFDDKRDHADAQKDFIAWVNGEVFPTLRSKTIVDLNQMADHVDGYRLISGKYNCVVILIGYHSYAKPEDCRIKLGCWERKPSLLDACQRLCVAMTLREWFDSFSGEEGCTWQSNAMTDVLANFKAEVKRAEEGT